MKLFWYSKPRSPAAELLLVEIAQTLEVMAVITNSQFCGVKISTQEALALAKASGRLKARRTQLQIEIHEAQNGDE